MIDIAATATEIEQRCRACGTPQRAEGERAYLKSDLEHFGSTVGEVRRIARECMAARPEPAHDDLIGLVTALWSRPVHECRMAAVMLLQLYPRLLGVDDLDVVESMVRGSLT